MARTRYEDDPWGYTEGALRGAPWGSGQPLADLAEVARDAWKGAVTPAPAWHNTRLEFSRADERGKRRAMVYVLWQDGVFEFQLLDKQGRLVSADRAFAATAPSVLYAFLYQVAGDGAPDLA